jgi:hypothetical protein
MNNVQDMSSQLHSRRRSRQGTENFVRWILIAISLLLGGVVLLSVSAQSPLAGGPMPILRITRRPMPK